MRRVTILVSVLVVMLLGGLSVATAAQEGTPPADGGALEGVSIEPLGFGTTEEFPVAPADFALSRIVIDPGGGFPRPEVVIALLYVESGALTIQVEAPIQVTRAATIEALTTGAGEIPEPEEVEAGTEVTLEAGDSVVIPPNVAGEIRNDGDEPVVYLAAFAVPLEEGGAIEEGGATPAA